MKPASQARTVLCVGNVHGRWAWLASILLSCQPDHCNTPFGAGGTIDLIDYSNLYNHVGGTEMISCGYKGVLVRCSGFSEYTAFECACPHDHEVRMQPDDSKEAVILTCPSCGSYVRYSRPKPGFLLPNSGIFSSICAWIR